MYAEAVEWLNYHHLLYFWFVAKEGSVTRACARLRLAQPTISGQLRQFEEALGEKLFLRVGRGLALTEVGHVVFRYAEEIFSIGQDLQDAIKGWPRNRPDKLIVGISDAVPKLIAYRILQPVLNLSSEVQLTCIEDKPDRLLAALSTHEIDIVLSDSPVTAISRVRAFNHLLGSCSVSLFAIPDLASRYRRNFPKCLDQAPFLLPMENAALRRSLDQWFVSHQVRPRCVGEFQDSALMKTFGQAGAGIFAGPTAIAKEIRSIYKVVSIATLDNVDEQFFAISIERRLRNPAIVAISEAARQKLFAADRSAVTQ